MWWSCCLRSLHLKHCLAIKTVFPVAIISAWRISELQVLMVGPPYTSFHWDKVVMKLHPKFIPTVLSEFHLNLPVTLVIFFLNPHMLPDKTKLCTMYVVQGHGLLHHQNQTFQIFSLPFYGHFWHIKGSISLIPDNLSGLHNSFPTAINWLASLSLQISMHTPLGFRRCLWPASEIYPFLRSVRQPHGAIHWCLRNSVHLTWIRALEKQYFNLHLTDIA